MNQDVVGMARVLQLWILRRSIPEPSIGGFDENLRLVSSRSQDALDAEHLIADRVAVAQRRQHLVNRGRAARRSFREGGHRSVRFPRRTAAAPAAALTARGRRLR